MQNRDREEKYILLRARYFSGEGEETRVKDIE
jgi:hypothetical protein